jgi:hypothetical protein
MAFDKAGNLYGTTATGGTGSCFDGRGVVYKLAPRAGGKWKYTVLTTLTVVARPRRTANLSSMRRATCTVLHSVWFTRLRGSRNDSRGGDRVGPTGSLREPRLPRFSIHRRTELRGGRLLDRQGAHRLGAGFDPLVVFSKVAEAHGHVGSVPRQPGVRG